MEKLANGYSYQHFTLLLSNYLYQIWKIIMIPYMWCHEIHTVLSWPYL